MLFCESLQANTTAKDIYIYNVAGLALKNPPNKTQPQVGFIGRVFYAL